MPQYIVKVRYSFDTNVKVIAEDEAEAAEKATDVVLKWKNVKDAEALETKETEI